jgi:hypothetical protein
LTIDNHPSFDRPLVTTQLWRYMDLPKFIDLITSSTLWLANAEVLASDDPYEGLPGALQFPHRMWTSIKEVPELLRQQIIEMSCQGTDGTPEAAFKSWFMQEEQRCIMAQSGRRNYYVNCWHGAGHESVAMWKIYGSPGTGVAMVTNAGRLESSLAANNENLYLGAVHYTDPNFFQIGTPNGFDNIMRKRANYSYEQEVRLVHWHTGEMHDALANFAWNEELMRFEDLIQDTRPIRPGMSLSCDIEIMVEKVIISPFAPSWYEPMIDRLKKRLDYKFTVQRSQLFDVPSVLP